MILIGVLGIFVLRYGPKMRYLLFILVTCWFGIYMTLRHTGNLIGLDQGQGFGDSIMGAHTYSWGVFVYWFATFAVCLILLFMRKNNPVTQDFSGTRAMVKPFSRFTNVVVALSLLVIVSNAFQAFLENGVPPFSGKRRPARFTLDIAKASKDWTPSFWNRVTAPWGLRGPENVEFPYLPGINENSSKAKAFSVAPEEGPLPLSNEKIVLANTYPLPFEPKGCNGSGVVTGVAFNPQQNKFGFVTNNAGIYYTTPDFSKVTDSAILDKPNGNDIKLTVDTTFAGNKMISTAHNKTIWGNELMDPSKIDPWWQWRIFREATPSVAPVWKFNRPWLQTARAKKSYVASAAFDPATNELHLITVPNEQNPKTILSTFDMGDKQVVRERNLTPAPGLMLKEGKKFPDYYVVGAAMKDGKLLALSKAYNSLLEINPQTAQIEKVLPLPEGLSDPRSLEYKDGKLYTVGLKDGKNVVYELAL